MQQSPIIVAYSCSAARDFGVTAIKNGALIYFGAYDPNIYSNNNFKIFFGNLTSLSAAQNQILSRISNNNTSALETGIPLQAVFESDPTILYGDPSVLVPVFKTPLGLRLLIDDNLAKSSLEFSYFDINLFNPFFDCLYLTAADEDTLIATSPGSAEAYIYSRKYVGTDFKKFLEYLSEKDDYARAYSFFNQAYTQISDFSSFMVNGKKYFTYLSHDAPDPSIFSKFNVLIISEDKMSARICLNESFAKGNQVGPRKIIISGKDYFG
jgi:hypothetical protein